MTFAKLGLPAKEVELSDHLVIARCRGSLVALRIDRAVELVRLELDDAEGDTRDREGIVGFAKLLGGLAPILNLEALI